MIINKDTVNYIIVFIISLILVLDLFLHTGQPATFDGNTHITTIAQFTHVLKSGDFPVVWADGYANYGYPLGILVHQLPFYSGAVISLIVNNYVLAYNLLIFLSILISGLFFYKFLRLYFSPIIALLGTVIFTFSPYKIINIYIRGAMPEVFATLFVPLILLATHNFMKRKNILSIITLVTLFTLLALTHPFLFVIELFITFPYFIFLFIKENKITKNNISHIKDHLKILYVFCGMIVLSLAIAGYYLIPLILEGKYIVYSLRAAKPFDFLSWNNFLNSNWYYYYQGDIFTRGHFIKAGIVEFFSIFAGVVAVVYKWLFKKDRSISILEYAVITGLIILFFMTQYSLIFYKYVRPLAEIQFPWRMLSAFMFIPPIIIAHLFKNIKSNLLIMAVMVAFSIQYLPQLYGKNYTIYNNQHYLFTITNLIGREQNTIWTGKTEDYPVKKQKFDIVGGTGTVTKADVHNSWRQYSVSAKTPLRMVDYTFYFPGWNVYVDKQPVLIEFQDPNYRGVITYHVPQGNHTVFLKFEDTKIRLMAKIISLLSLILFPILLFLIKKKNVLNIKAA